MEYTVPGICFLFVFFALWEQNRKKRQRKHISIYTFIKCGQNLSLITSKCGLIDPITIHLGCIYTWVFMWSVVQLWSDHLMHVNARCKGNLLAGEHNIWCLIWCLCWDSTIIIQYKCNISLSYDPLSHTVKDQRPNCECANAAQFFQNNCHALISIHQDCQSIKSNAHYEKPIYISGFI